MTVLCQPTVTYLSVSREVWLKYPEERPLAEFARDIVGIVRVGAKTKALAPSGDLIHVKRMRLAAIANTLLLKGLFEERLVFSGEEAKLVLSLLAALGRQRVFPEALGFVLPQFGGAAIQAWNEISVPKPAGEALRRQVVEFHARSNQIGAPVLVTFHE